MEEDATCNLEAQGYEKLKIEQRPITISNKAELENLFSALFENFEAEGEDQYITGQNLAFSEGSLPRGLAIFKEELPDLDDDLKFPIVLGFVSPAPGAGSWLAYYEDCLDRLTRFGLWQWICTWVLALVLWPLVTCQNSLPAWSLIPISVLLGASVLWEYNFVDRMHADVKCTFLGELWPAAWAKVQKPSDIQLHVTNLPDINAEGAAGLSVSLLSFMSPNSLLSTYLFGLLDRLDFVSDALLVPQAFACMEDIQKTWLASWHDSAFSVMAEPIFQTVGFGPFVAILYFITVFLLQGCRSFLDIRRKYQSLERSKIAQSLDESKRNRSSDFEEQFPYPPEVADTASAFGLLSISKVFMAIQKEIDEGGNDAQDAMDMASDRALVNEITYKVVAENVVQMYFSSTFFALTFETKSASGKAILVATSCLSIVSALLKLMSLRQMKTDNYTRRALLLTVVVVTIVVMVVAKLAGAFFCQESHMLNIVPPHCVAERG
eukprot:TRINITY_DN106562_c0_g1_i1.p1 TRINITY_DN106562_c0_g1~~TRINITY_DN106562_c0_g1_i1.p1  ORF type:complete len:493 (-),score=85.38 TRINITY_DN106562_c0_g1_i1:63-1541(-)